MALEETDELVLKHSATGSEQTTHSFQSFYVKHMDDKGETHYIPVEYVPFEVMESMSDEEVDIFNARLTGFIVKRDRQES